MTEEKGAQAAVQKKGRKPWTLREFGGKTVWDWLQLIGVLAIPVVIAVGGCMFNAQQNERQNALEDQRARQAQKIEDQRAEAERELAEQRAQDEALQAYLDQMSALLMEQNLRDSNEDSEVRTLARARTLTVLGRLDARRRTQVLQFLDEAKLIGSVNGKDPIVRLRGADLNGVDLSGADLSGADLSEADLSEADLISADLSGADLFNAILRDAVLYGADLPNVHLITADLSGADLSEADLSGAVLIETDLSEAVLFDADLSGAVLSGAQGTTKEQLEQAKTLEGATMPNGQKYEDWLKSKGSGEDGENSGPS